MRTLSFPALSILSLVALAGGCDRQSDQSPAPPSRSAAAKPPSSATTSTSATMKTAAAPAPQPLPAKSPIELLLVGEAPADVKLDRGSPFRETVRHPTNWTAKNDAVPFLMRKSGDAAMLCRGADTPFTSELFIKPAQIRALAKRAPILGKELEAEGEDTILLLGANQIQVRAGTLKGTTFGDPDGRVHWWDVRWAEKPDAKPHQTFHSLCVAASKPGAGDAERELMAIVRTYKLGSGEFALKPKGEPEK